MPRVRSPLAPVALAAAAAASLVLLRELAFVPQGASPQPRPASASEVGWGLRRGGDLRGQAAHVRLAAVVETMDADTKVKVPTAEAASVVATPKEAYFTMVEKGEYIAKMAPLHILHQAMVGGAYIGFGGLLSLSIAGNLAGAVSSNPGLGRLVFGALFPVNLLLVLLTGAQLFTGNTCTLPAAYFEGRVTMAQIAKSWGVSIVGNILGCFLFAAATRYCGLLVGGTGDLAIATCLKKTSATFGHTLVKAIGANWLVCMAVFLSSQARDMTGKMVGIWFPISTFVAIGLEHSVANMFLLPAGIMAGAPVTYTQMVLKNWIPVMLGNAIAGAICVAASYSYAYGRLGGN